MAVSNFLDFVFSIFPQKKSIESIFFLISPTTLIALFLHSMILSTSNYIGSKKKVSNLDTHVLYTVIILFKDFTNTKIKLPSRLVGDSEAIEQQTYKIVSYSSPFGLLHFTYYELPPVTPGEAHFLFLCYVRSKRIRT